MARITGTNIIANQYGEKRNRRVTSRVYLGNAENKNLTLGVSPLHYIIRNQWKRQQQV